MTVANATAPDRESAGLSWQEIADQTKVVDEQIQLYRQYFDLQAQMLDLHRIAVIRPLERELQRLHSPDRSQIQFDEE